MKYAKLWTISMITIAMLLFAFALIQEELWPTDNHFKKYIIENRDRLRPGENAEGYYTLTYTGFYFEDITIQESTDHSYRVIIWGDRSKSARFWWGIFKDYQFSFDNDELLREGIAKKKSYKLDREILRIINGEYE